MISFPRLRTVCSAAALAYALLLFGSVTAADEDPFAPSNRAVPAAAPAAADPFSEANKAPETTSSSPLAAPIAAPPSRTMKKEPPTAKRIDFEVSVTPKEVRRGETITLTITGIPKPGFHTYPITQRADNPNQDPSGLSKIIWQATPGLKPLWPITETPPELKDVEGQGYFLEYGTRFSWTQDVLVLSDAEPGPKSLVFVVKLQVCNEGTCVTGEHPFELSVVVANAAPIAPSDTIQARLPIGPQEPKIVPVPAAKSSASRAAAPEAKAVPAEPVKPEEADKSVLGFVAVSAGAALLMLFTPCVFPMIPITVSFFLKQSEKQHHNALLTAAVYAITIVVVLTAAVLLLGNVIIRLANNPWLNLGLGAVLLFFALSLFGMYEIELPSGLARFTASHEGKGGYLGAMFMALTFVITSFTCTGPFLGPLLGAAATSRPSTDKLILGAFAYSATFAAPFFVLALFPRLLKTLPKSGGWLNGVKVVMGFVEVALAMKFLSISDATWNPGSPAFLNYDTVLCAWIALSLACGMYLLGLFRLPHDSPVEHIGVSRMLLASLFFGLALYMTPALWRKTPQGVVGEFVVSFLPLDTDRGLPGGGGEKALAWHLDYEKAWAEAVKDNKLIFIDFTGVNCQNCRSNEQKIFPRANVQQELARYVRVKLYTDVVPDDSLPARKAEELAKRNMALQDETFGDVTLPAYIVFKPAKDAPFENGKLKGTEIGRFTGLIFDSRLSEFVSLLKRTPDKQVARGQSAERDSAR